MACSFPKPFTVKYMQKQKVTCFHHQLLRRQLPQCLALIKQQIWACFDVPQKMVCQELTPRLYIMTTGRFGEKDANFLPKFTPVSQVGGEKFIENVLRWEPVAQLYSHYQTVWENISSIIWTFNIALFLSNPLLNSKPIIVIFWKTPYPFQNKIFG